MKKLVIISFVISTIIFLLLPSYSQKVFYNNSQIMNDSVEGACPATNGAPCIDNGDFTVLTIYRIVLGEHMADEYTYLEIARNTLVFVPSLALLGIYLFKKRSTNNIK